MKTGKTLSELAAEIDRQQNVKRDFVADTNVIKAQVRRVGEPVERVGFDLAFRTNGDEETFGIGRHCHTQIAERVQIPQRYYDRMLEGAPDLWATNVNHWFENDAHKRMIRTLDGNARAFLSSRFRCLDNYDLLQAVLPRIGELGCRIESCEVTETRLYIKAVTERIEGEVKVGDTVQAGILIANSEVGKGRIRVEPLLFRLACKNGMVVNAMGLKRTHVGKDHGAEIEGAAELFTDETKTQDDKAFWMKVRDVVAGTLSGDTFEQIIARWREATGQKIEGDPVKAVEVTARRFNLGEGERGGVLRHLIEGGDLSAYGLMNAITRFSQDVDDYDRATELEAVGPAVLELPRQDWQTIALAS